MPPALRRETLRARTRKLVRTQGRSAADVIAEEGGFDWEVATPRTPDTPLDNGARSQSSFAPHERKRTVISLTPS